MIDNQIDTQVEDNDILIIPSEHANIIKVIGVGGGGGNAVNHMFKYGIKDVDFIIANTDNQALEKSPIPVKIQLGASLTQGLGAGNNPERGSNAARESHDLICDALDIQPDGETPSQTKMLFVTAGMGGGTGTGAAPVIAKIAKDAGILTVAIVTLPFRWEGPKRVTQAIEGLQLLSENVDSLLVVDNEKVMSQFKNLKLSDAFGCADDVLTKAAKGIAEIITNPGGVNVDFADVNTVLKDSGIALMGTGVGEGENRDSKAIEAALSSPLLSNNDINGAKNVLINMVTSEEHQLTMDELANINQTVQVAAGCQADLIWGQSTDDSLGDRLGVTIVVSGFKSSKINNPFENGGKYMDMEAYNRIIKSTTSFINISNAPAGTAEETKPETEQPEAQKAQESQEPKEGQQAQEPQEAAAGQEKNDSAESEPEHQAGDEVDLGSIEYDEDFDEEDDEKVIEPTRNFHSIDYSSVNDLDNYDKIPAYQRKGLTLNINNYNASFKRTPLNEA